MDDMQPIMTLYRSYSSFSHNFSNAVLNTLEPLKVNSRDTSKQVITVVKIISIIFKIIKAFVAKRATLCVRYPMSCFSSLM